MSACLNNNNKIVIELDNCDYEAYISRMRSIIRLAQNQREISEEDQYFALELLNDMLPTVDQAKEMFTPKRPLTKVG